MADYSAQVAALTTATNALHTAVEDRKTQLDQAVTDTNAHKARTDNPHAVTKAQVGLPDVDNVPAVALRDRSTHTGTQTLATITDAGTAAAKDVGSGIDEIPTNALLRSDYGLEFKPSVRETLLLDFANNIHRVEGALGPVEYRLVDADLPGGGVDPGAITFTRASGATRVNALGKIELMGVDEPRIDHDPVTGECLGLLIEEARTNLLPWSEALDNAVWAKTTGTTVTANAGVSPDGTQTADLLEFDGPDRQCSQGITLVNGTEYSFSLYVKGTAGETIRFGSGILSAGNFVLTGDWQRIIISASSTGTSGTVVISTYGGATARSVYIWGAQLEAGAFPTSYIPTTDLAVTRAQDFVSINNAADWINDSEMTLFVESQFFTKRPASSINSVFLLDQTSGSGYVSIWSWSGSDAFNASVISDAGTGAGLGVTEAQAGLTLLDMTKQALSAQDGTCVFAVNGFSLSGSRTMPTTLNRARLMAGSHPSGRVKRAVFYPRALSAAELEQLTAGGQ